MRSRFLEEHWGLKSAALTDMSGTRVGLAQAARHSTDNRSRRGVKEIFRIVVRVVLSSHSIPGTVERLSTHTSMNQHPRRARGCGARLNGHQHFGRSQARAACLRGHANQETDMRPDLRALFEPARDLMISLGWLRLFRTIVAPILSLPSSRENTITH